MASPKVRMGAIAFDESGPCPVNDISHLPGWPRHDLERAGFMTMRERLSRRAASQHYAASGILRWRDEQFGDSSSPLWMVPCRLVSHGPDVPSCPCLKAS